MKKMNNKGFSMVELIIVIAIMAILAGALAPTLIKYVNKSRMSSDVSNAQTIAGAVQTSYSDPSSFDSLPADGTYTLASLLGTAGSFGTNFKTTVGVDAKIKYKKALSDGNVPGTDYQIGLKTTDGNVEVKVYAGNANIQLYPDVHSDYQK